MKKSILLIIVSFILICNVKAQTINYDSLRNEIKTYREILKHSHTGLNLYTSEKQFDSLFNKLDKDLPKIKTRRDYYLRLCEIHTFIRCGHSSMYNVPLTENDIIKEILPFKIKFLGNKAYVENSYCEIKKGSEIVSINGHLILEITKEAFKLISSDGYNTSFKYRILESDFNSYYFLIFGKTNTCKIHYTEYHTNSRKILDISTKQEDYNIGKEPNKEKTFDDIYNLKVINNNTALLTVNSFDTPTKKLTKRYFKFLKKAFKTIKKKDIKNLIIDIRENTGGNDGNDMELASYIINKPFKENKYRIIKHLNLVSHSELLSPYLNDMLGIDNDTPKSEIAKMMNKEVKNEFENKAHADGYYYLKEEKVIKRKPKKNRFKGNIYIMTSGNVFSGGGLFSALVRDKSDAIFVGEETGGGYYRHTGSIPLIYELPYSKIPFSIFTVINEQDVDQKLFPKGTGTIPHYKVHQNPDELVNNIDAVLNKCLELIKK